MKNKVMILAAAITLVACGGNQQKKAVSEKVKADAVKVDMHDAESSLDYQGTYTGVFPAADCPGIQTTLKLNPDGTYELHLKYIDRDAEFDETGVFTVKENLLTLAQLDDGSEEYYKIEENRLRMLDAEKQPVSGALAENYVLQKIK